MSCIHPLLGQYCRRRIVNFLVDFRSFRRGVAYFSNRLSDVAVLQRVRDIKPLQQVHSQIVVSDLSGSVFVCNKLVNAYASFGHIHEARLLFPLVPNKNVVSWTILVSGLGKNGLFVEAIQVFSEMVVQEIKPNERTIASVLPALGKLKLVQMGKSVHCFWVRQGFGDNVVVETAFVDTYARFGCMGVSQYLFDKMSVRNIVSWNSIISGYAENGLAEEALWLFSMMRMKGFCPDIVTLTSLVGSQDSKIGASIHGLMTKTGFSDDQLSEMALMEMYINCNLIDDAYCIFEELNHQDLIAWTLMLRGFSKSGDWGKIIQHFNKMMTVNHVRLDTVPLITLLSACSSSGALQQGKQVHTLVIKTGFEADSFVGSALIDMYMNCACISDARKCSQQIERRDIACWNVLISGYGMMGLANEAIDLFHEMRSSGLAPDELTFISVLSACSHAGLVSQGLQIFHHMTGVCGITPTSKHYACVVDLLARGGLLTEAYSFMKQMHLQPGLEAYCSLLTACKIHKKFQLADEISHELLQLKPDDAGYYVLVSNVSCFAGNLSGARMSRKCLKSSNLKKNPGCSSVYVNGESFSFMAGQTDHPHYEEIKEILFGLNSRDGGVLIDHEEHLNLL